MKEEDIEINDEDVFEIEGLQVEKDMDDNLKNTIIRYNLVHKKIMEDLQLKS